MINFPSNPFVGQKYEYLTRTWKWNGSAWAVVNSDNSTSVVNNVKISNYTLTETDNSDTMISVNSDVPAEITVEEDLAVSSGTSVMINQMDDGRVSVSSNLNIRSPESSSLKKKNAKAYLIKVDENTWDLEGNLLTGPVYFINPYKNSVLEGNIIRFIVNTISVGNATLYWRVLPYPGLFPEDFDSAVNGTVEIINDKGVITLSVIDDLLLENVEKIRLELKSSQEGEVLAVSSFVLIEQPDLDVYWANIYEYMDIPYDPLAPDMLGMFQAITSDINGNIIATGSDYGDENLINIVKFNKDGELLWQKKIGELATYNNMYAELVQTDNLGNIYVLSQNDDPQYLTTNRGTVKGIYKLSPGGDLILQKEFELGTGGSLVEPYYYDFGSLIKVFDGFILSLEEGAFLKIDFNLNIKWAFRLLTQVGSNPTYYTGYTGMWVQDLTHFYIAGSSSNYADSGRGQIWKFTLNGSKIWGKGLSYTGPSPDPTWARVGDLFYSVTQTDNYIFAISDYSNELIKMDLEGNLIWVKRYRNPRDDDDLSEIKFILLSSYNNEVIIVGDYRDNTDDVQFVMKIDAETDEIITLQKIKNIEDYISWFWYTTDKGSIKVTDTSIIIGGYTDINGIVYKLPRNLENYPLGLRTDNGTEFETIPVQLSDITIVDVTSYYQVADITSSPLLSINSIFSVNSSYQISDRENTIYGGTLVPK